jgi:phage gpG-like protein
MDFAIKLTPESQAKIDALAKAGRVDLRPTLNVIGKGYRKEASMIFGRQQPRGEGMRWAPLSTRYAAWKQQHYPMRALLVRTGALLSSMTEEGARGNISVIGKNGAIFGSSISYGIFHDEGTSRMPKRNFSDPSERRKAIWIEQIGKDIRHNFEVNGIQVEGSVFA